MEYVCFISDIKSMDGINEKKIPRNFFSFFLNELETKEMEKPQKKVIQIKCGEQIQKFFLPLQYETISNVFGLEDCQIFLKQEGIYASADHLLPGESYDLEVKEIRKGIFHFYHLI